jgi:hypothetical protein
MKITIQSIFGKIQTMDIPITQEQWSDVVAGEKHIQKICPEIKACEREFLISGTTPKGWEKMFGGCTKHCKPCKYNVKQIEDE